MIRGLQNVWRKWGEALTVEPIIRAADGGDGVAAADDELVKLTLVVHRLRLGQGQGLEVQPGHEEHDETLTIMMV